MNERDKLKRRIYSLELGVEIAYLEGYKDATEDDGKQTMETQQSGWNKSVAKSLLDRGRQI